MINNYKSAPSVYYIVQGSRKAKKKLFYIKPIKTQECLKKSALMGDRISFEQYSHVVSKCIQKLN